VPASFARCGHPAPRRVDPGERHRPCCPGSRSDVNVARDPGGGIRGTRL